MPSCWPAHPQTPLSLTPSLSLSPPPSLFPDKKFPVEANFWLDELFYYIEDYVLCAWSINNYNTKQFFNAFNTF